jgi:ferredoxin-NADP reductase
MAMLRHHAAVTSAVAATVLVSARGWDDVLYRDELSSLDGDGVTVRYTLTRAQPPEWKGWSGRVNAEMLRELGADRAGNVRVFICGPTGFVEHVANLLVQLGHDPHAIKTERFGPTGG